MPAQDIYHEDLAQIHVAGYEFHWKNAARTVLDFLHEHNIPRGTVVDLGCGGGQWLENLASRGYRVCGVDASPSMIRIARKRLPSASFILGSFAEVELPCCDAVTSLGEPINYLDGMRSIKRTIREVYRALRPGGLFVLDAVHPATPGVEPRTAARTGDTWACIAVIEEQPERNLLVRHITTFREVNGEYQRHEETHRLRIYPKSEMLRWFRAAGFRVCAYAGYGDYRFRLRQTALVAHKPQD